MLSRSTTRFTALPHRFWTAAAAATGAAGLGKAKTRYLPFEEKLNGLARRRLGKQLIAVFIALDGRAVELEQQEPWLDATALGWAIRAVSLLRQLHHQASAALHVPST